MQTLKIIKIGGNVIDDPQALDAFLRDFARMEGPKVLVHGGGALASRVLAGMGIEPRMTSGRRITDAETLRVVTMVYAGWINKDIVARLQAAGCNAAGLSGADGNAIPSVRRAPVPVDFGFVGDPDPAKIDTAFIRLLSDAGVTPVFCAITHDGRGSLLNTNADTVASSLAVALADDADTKNNGTAVQLIYCFEKPGVLADPDDDGSVIPTLSASEYAAMKVAGTAKAGMLAKLDNAFAALSHGVSEVMIKQASDLLRQSGTRLSAD